MKLWMCSTLFAAGIVGRFLCAGNLRLDTLDATFAGPAAETWHDVLNKL